MLSYHIRGTKTVPLAIIIIAICLGTWQGAGASPGPQLIGGADGFTVVKGEPAQGVPMDEEAMPWPMPGRVEVAVGNPPLITWPENRGAVSYLVSFSQDKSFREGVYTAANITETFYLPSEVLSPGKWYVRYQAYDGKAFTRFSNVAKIEIPAAAKEFSAGDVYRLPAHPGRPRMYMHQLAQLRQRQELEEFAGYLQLIERYLQQEAYGDFVPDPSVDESAFGGSTSWHKAVQAGNIASMRMLLPAFYYMITGEQKALEEAKRIALAVSTWKVRGKTSITFCDHAARDILSALSMVYDWLYEEFSADERQQIRETIARRARQMYDHYTPFRGDGSNNHVWFNVAALGEAGVALLGEVPEAAGWVRYAIGLYTSTFLPVGGRDGEWHEGISYWSYMLWYVFTFADSLQAATGIDLYAHPWLQETANFIIYAHPPHTVGVNFGNAHLKKVEPLDIIVAARLASATDNPYAQWYARSMRLTEARGTSLTNLAHFAMLAYLWSDPGQEARAPATLHPDRHFREAGWTVFHTDLARPEDDVLLALRSGPYLSVHNHADQNNFVLHAYKDRLIVDAGYYDVFNSPHQTKFSRLSKAHNVVLVNGRGQNDQTRGADGQIEQFVSVDGFGYVRADASNPKIYGGELKEYQRELLFVKPDVIVVRDTIEAARPEAKVDWLLHFAYQPKIQPGKGLTVTGERAGLKLRILAPAQWEASLTDEFPVPPERKQAGEFPNQWHFTASFAARPQAEVVALLLPHRQGNTAPDPDSWSFQSDGGVQVLSKPGIAIFLAGEKAGTWSAAGIYSDARVVVKVEAVSSETKYLMIEGSVLKTEDAVLYQAADKASVLVKDGADGSPAIIQMDRDRY